MGALVVALYLTVFKLCVLIGPDLIQAGVFVYFGLSLLGLSREVPAHWVAGMIAYFLGRIALERYQPQWAHRVHTALSAVWTLALGIAVAADPRFHPVYAVLGAIVGALVGSYVNFGSPIAFPLVLEHQFIQLSRRFSAWRAQRTAHSPLRDPDRSSRNTSAPRTDQPPHKHRKQRTHTQQPPPPAPPPAGPTPDAWAILGVPPDASMSQIRRAYLGLMRQYHPDRVMTLGPELQELAEQKAKEINRAYELLRGRR